jgi:ribulose-5-phosphate 4-epimerase/fuculose-1-phosphate aldolase
MKFAISKQNCHPWRDELMDEIAAAFEAHGHELCNEDDEDVRLVFNLADATAPRPYRRRSRAVFVVTMIATDQLVTEAHKAVYTLLVRSLSNMAMYVVPWNGRTEVYFATLEAGFYHIPYDPTEVYRELFPLATSRLIIENDLIPDLPESYWGGTEITGKMIRYGAELDRLGVLPSPFPLHELLSEQDLRHVYRLYGITGLSYGNLSARESIPELGEATFWMSARGVDKAQLSTVGKDMLLVKGFDAERGVIRLSVPPHHDPKARVSVDAIEHHMIYSSFPEVNAIVHVHAWMNGIVCTHQNFPCGTRELALEVVELLHQTDTPGQTVVGLKNHGLTITGQSLDEIFDRIRGKLQTEVPMIT